MYWPCYMLTNDCLFVFISKYEVTSFCSLPLAADPCMKTQEWAGFCDIFYRDMKWLNKKIEPGIKSGKGEQISPLSLSGIIDHKYCQAQAQISLLSSLFNTTQKLGTLMNATTIFVVSFKCRNESHLWLVHLKFLLGIFQRAWHYWCHKCLSCSQAAMHPAVRLGLCGKSNEDLDILATGGERWSYKCKAIEA